MIIDEDEDDESCENIDTNLNVTGQGIVTGCLIFGGQTCRYRMRVIRTRRAPDDIETEEEDPLQCQVCKKYFSHSTNLQQHVCQGITGKRDLVYYALSYSCERIDQHEFEIHTMRNPHSINVFDIVPSTIPSVHLKAGWAQTPGHGRMYGRKYIDPFKEDIVEMFRAGFQEKSARMGAGKMLEKLKQKYPRRLDLPPETEIRQAISTLMAKQKKGQNMCLLSGRGISQPYIASVVRIFVESNGLIKPAEAWRLFKIQHPIPNELQSSYPSEGKVKSKISALKVAFKKNNTLPNVPE